MSTPPSQLKLPRPLESRRSVWIETIVIFIAVVAPQIFASTIHTPRSRPTETFMVQSEYRFIQSIGTVALILFIISKSRRSPRRFGLFRFRAIRDPLAGAGLFIGSMLVYYIFWYSVQILMHSYGASSVQSADTSTIATPVEPWQYLILAAMSFANAAAEEIVMRAYLLTRIEQFVGSIPALILTAGLFASYHTYQGTTGALSAALIGLIYGAVFIRYRRLWPLIVAHGIQDIYAIAALAASR